MHFSIQKLWGINQGHIRWHLENSFLQVEGKMGKDIQPQVSGFHLAAWHQLQEEKLHPLTLPVRIIVTLDQDVIPECEAPSL